MSHPRHSVAVSLSRISGDRLIDWAWFYVCANTT